MARKSILTDELLHQLVAVGQVDIMVGVPTLDHAATIESVIRTLHVGLAKHFPRERTVIVVPDGGSTDGTLDHVRAAPMADEELRGSTTLRTTHRVTGAHHGAAGWASGVRVVFAAADLLQAKVVLLVDPSLTSLSPDWIGAMGLPLWKDQADIVLPIHPRHRFEAPLITQLVRPLLTAATRRRLEAQIIGEFGCIGKHAAQQVPRAFWDAATSQPALDVWLAGTALAEDRRVLQVHLGAHDTLAPTTRSVLRELFGQVVGSTFACLEQHAGTWLGRDASVLLPVHGEPGPGRNPGPVPDRGPLAERYCNGVRDLAPILRDVLQPGTWAGLSAAAAAGPGHVSIPDPLWVHTLYEFAAAWHREVMSREHLTQAMLPVYLGRTASYFTEMASVEEAAVPGRLRALDDEFERARPYLIECWNADGGR